MEAEGDKVISTTEAAQKFQFIDVSLTSLEQKRRNRTIARSHAMRNVRAGQRRVNRPATRKTTSLPPVIPNEEEIETIWSDSASHSGKWQDRCAGGLTPSIPLCLSRTSLSPFQRLMVEYDTTPSKTYTGKPTPALHASIDYCKYDISTRFLLMNSPFSLNFQ
jgi:hypothetical protein